MQAAGRQQPAGGQQQQAQGQVDSGARLSLGFDRVGVDGEHVQQADRQGHGHAAEQDAQEHRPWLPVLDQQQVEGEELGIQRRGERQREEFGVHRRSARVRDGPRWVLRQPEVFRIGGNARLHRVGPACPLKLRRHLPVVPAGIVTAVEADDLKRAGIAAFRAARRDADGLGGQQRQQAQLGSGQRRRAGDACTVLLGDLGPERLGLTS